MTSHSPNRRRLLAGLCTTSATIAWPSLALASEASANFPTRPLRFIVPFPPGSGTDTTARLFAKKIGEITGQGTVVENKAGGNGFIAVQSLLSAPADGHTVFIGSNSTLSTNAALFKKLPYDPLKDFAPISLLSRGACVVIVPVSSKYQTLKDLIDDARKRPGALNFGSGSISYRLYSEWLNEMVGMKTTEIPFKGAGAAVNAIVSGEVDFAVVDASGAIELINGGRVRALAFTAPERSPLIPQIPNASEAGIPHFLAYNWVAAAVSARTPPAIVEQLIALFQQVGAAPDVRAYYARQSSSLLMTPPAELTRYQKEEIERWKRLAQTVNIEQQ